MDVRIGISDTPAVIDVEVPDDTDRDGLKAAVADAIAAGTLFWLTDKKGKESGIPGAKIAFVEIGSPDDGRRVGFGA